MHTVTQKIDFFKTCFGENYSLSRDGVNIAFQCPACGKGTDKLKFSLSLNTFVCHCWVCNLKGKTPYYIIKQYANIDKANEFFIQI